MGRNEARGNGQGRSASGNEPDPEKGPIFWPVYFYSLANLEFGLAGRQSRVSSWTTVGIAICTTRFEIRNSRQHVILCFYVGRLLAVIFLKAPLASRAWNGCASCQPREVSQGVATITCLTATSLALYYVS